MDGFVGKFIEDDSGATAIEYGLIAGAIFLAIVPAVALIAPELITIFTSASTGLQAN